MKGCGYDPEHFFLRKDTGEVWILPNAVFPHRDVGEAVWIDARHVCFDIDTGPHHGVHFVVDATGPRVVHVAHYHDAFVEGLERRDCR